jgi:hypothetical protein
MTTIVPLFVRTSIRDMDRNQTRRRPGTLSSTSTFDNSTKDNGRQNSPALNLRVLILIFTAKIYFQGVLIYQLHSGVIVFHLIPTGLSCFVVSLTHSYPCGQSSEALHIFHTAQDEVKNRKVGGYI